MTPPKANRYLGRKSQEYQRTACLEEEGGEEQTCNQTAPTLEWCMC